MKYMFSSIRGRLLLLLGLIFLAMLGIAAYLTITERQNNLSDSMADLEGIASKVAEEQNAVINYAQQMITLLPQAYDLRNPNNSQCQPFLAQWVKREPRFASILIADREGKAVCNSIATRNPINIADRDYFRKALTTDRIVIGKAIIGRSSGKWVLPFAMAMRDNAGRSRGYLVAALDLQWINRELSRAKLPEGARIGLIDGEGTVLARHPDPEQWIGRSAAKTIFFATITSLHGTGTAESIGFDGSSRIYGFAHFAETMAGPIYLWVGVPKESVTGPVEQKFLWTLSIALVLLAAAFGFAWFGSERWVLRPLSTIANVAHRLGSGEYDARTKLDYAGELGRLAQSIDEMAASLMSHNEILRLNRALRLLSLCNKALVHAGTEQQLLAEICRIVVEKGGHRMAWVGLAENDEQKSVRPVAQYGYEEGYLETARISWADTERGRGPTGTAIRTGTAQINQNFSTNPALAPWRADALKRGYQSSTALPLKDDGNAFGALTIYSKGADAFSHAEMLLLEELAEDLAYGIKTLRMRAAHDAWEIRLERGMLGTIQAIATMLEMRDPYTAGHQKKVASLSMAIAHELALPEDEIRGIYLAGMVHDIGKIQIPSEILSKPSRLTEIEYKLIKEHARAGYEILKDIEFDWPIAELVLQHHERIDGSGYPRGLKGEEMLLGAKIMAVADTVDAMATHRPYRPARGLEAALDEIRAGSGKYFDPDVVAACDRLFRENRFHFTK